MKRMIVWPVVVFVVLMIAWLRAGRMLTLAVDWMVPFPVKSLAASPLSYHGSEFLVGGERLTIAMRNNENADLQVATDMQNRAVLSRGRDAFVLGPLTHPVNPNGPLIVDFGAEPGDQVRYIARTKGWNRSQYWIERRGASQDGQSEVFAVIRLCDLCLSEPGAGGSVEVYVNRAKEEVTKELGYQ